ncbi:MAG: phosphatidylserine decarboxylase family protein [Clostridiales bacterium]|nr:phosphatidylserine decarboxylase family protein [Clostridiales bacterium]
MRVKIHHEGCNMLVILLLVLLAINVPVYLMCRDLPAVYIPLIAVSVVFYLLVVNFFRSPRRRFKGDRDNIVVSSADGTVVAIEEVYEPEYLKCRCVQLSVFMSVFNVHANWFPVDGEVIYTRHHSGRFLAAYLPKSSTENERSTVVIRTAAGQDILMRQIAGAMARRIVTYAEPGDEASIEDHMGFIKFGSRIDLYLPLGTEILVKLKDKTVGGVTTVARLHPENSSTVNND